MCNADGEDIVVDVPISSAPTHADYCTPDIQARYPSYVWSMPFVADGEGIDMELTILPPDPATLMRSKPTYYKDHAKSKAIIDFDFWQPFTEWVSDLCWACSSSQISKLKQKL